MERPRAAMLDMNAGSVLRVFHRIRVIRELHSAITLEGLMPKGQISSEFESVGLNAKGVPAQPAEQAEA
jgi:hypothetical protein